MIRELKTKAEGEFTDYSSAVLVQDDVQCYRIVLDCNQQLDGASFQVTAKRADGEVIQDMGTVSGSRAEYVVANNMYAVMGEVVFRLTLVGADGSVLTAKELICNVVEANGEADLTGDDRVPALSALIAQASQAAAATDAANQAAQTANAAAEEANEAAQAASSVSSQIGDLDDLATNEKTNLVGAINELADFDEFTVTETVYNFTTSKRNVMLRANNDDPELNSCELHGTSNGQVITVYCPIAGNDRNSKDVIIYNYRESVGASVGQCVIAIGESRTFTYVNGYLNDASVSAAKSIDYGTEDYVRISKPAKRYFVQVPEGNTSTSLLQITNLSLERDKFYHVNAGLNITGHNYGKIIFSGLSDIIGQYLRNGTAENIRGTYICNETDDVSVTLSLNMVPKGAFFNFDGTTLYYTHVYGDIMILIGTSTIETLKMDAWVGNEITSFGFYTLNANAPFDPHSFIEITTV